MNYKVNEMYYFKSKLGIFYKVLVREIDEDVAIIKPLTNTDMLHNGQKVRVDKLYKNLPKWYIKEEKQFQKEAQQAEEILWKIKDGEDK